MAKPLTLPAGSRTRKSPPAKSPAPKKPAQKLPAAKAPPAQPPAGKRPPAKAGADRWSSAKPAPEKARRASPAAAKSSPSRTPAGKTASKLPAARNSGSRTTAPRSQAPRARAESESPATEAQIVEALAGKLTAKVGASGGSRRGFSWLASPGKSKPETPQVAEAVIESAVIPEESLPVAEEPAVSSEPVSEVYAGDTEIGSAASEIAAEEVHEVVDAAQTEAPATVVSEPEEVIAVLVVMEPEAVAAPEREVAEEVPVVEPMAAIEAECQAPAVDVIIIAEPVVEPVSEPVVSVAETAAADSGTSAAPQTDAWLPLAEVNGGSIGRMLKFAGDRIGWTLVAQAVLFVAFCVMTTKDGPLSGFQRVLLGGIPLFAMAIICAGFVSFRGAQLLLDKLETERADIQRAQRKLLGTETSAPDGFASARNLAYLPTLAILGVLLIVWLCLGLSVWFPGKS